MLTTPTHTGGLEDYRVAAAAYSCGWNRWHIGLYINYQYITSKLLHK